MYQGKFDRKNRPHSHERAAVMPRPSSKSKPAWPRMGGVIFYFLFFFYVFLFYLSVYFGLLWLRGWLTDYEAAQPEAKSQEVFAEIFADPDWEALYDMAGIYDTAYERKEAFAAYMENLVDGRDLTFAKTSTGLSEDRKYVVRMGSEKIAAFTLVDKNKDTAANAIPDWQLGGVELFFAREEQYFIRKPESGTAYVNGTPLGDACTVRISSSKAEAYLPSGVSGMRTCTQQVTGLIAEPEVRVLDERGAELPVSYDEKSHTFTWEPAAEEIGEEEKTTALNAVKTYALYMIAKAGEAEVAKYFDRGSEIYKTITDAELGYVQDAQSREFVDEAVSDYCRYNEDVFSVRVSLTLNLYRASGSVKENNIDQSLFFRRQSSGSWICFDMTAVDISEPVEQVRLTFMDGETAVHSEFYDAASAAIHCPQVPIPEGKRLSGWMVKETDTNGAAVMRLVFTPDETGYVQLPDASALEPMTLYPLIE